MFSPTLLEGQEVELELQDNCYPAEASDGRAENLLIQHQNPSRDDGYSSNRTPPDEDSPEVFVFPSSLPFLQRYLLIHVGMHQTWCQSGCLEWHKSRPDLDTLPGLVCTLPEQVKTLFFLGGGGVPSRLHTSFRSWSKQINCFLGVSFSTESWPFWAHLCVCTVGTYASLFVDVTWPKFILDQNSLHVYGLFTPF